MKGYTATTWTKATQAKFWERFWNQPITSQDLSNGHGGGGLGLCGHTVRLGDKGSISADNRYDFHWCIDCWSQPL